MTHLQQTCSDMVHSQEQLQTLHRIARHGLHQPQDKLLREQLRHATAVHTGYLEICGKALQRYPAANDATTLPGAA